MRQYRQGDVLLMEISAGQVKKRADRRESSGILALGEVTGHSHIIDPRNATVYFQDGLDSLSVNERSQVVEVHAKSATLRHQEHAALDIPRGFYLRIIQREYTPERFRRISD